MKSAKEYRIEARTALKGNWGVAIGIMIVLSVLETLLGATLVGAIVLTGAFIVGYAYANVMLLRRGKMQFGDIGYAFGIDNFTSTIGLAVKTEIFIFLWSLLFFIPGIIATYRYSMAPYILADHPELTGGQAIKASSELMKGKKWKLFCLEFSFIGWILLSFLTLGILMLWIAPWTEAAMAAFYESIKDEVKLPSEN